jgi:hypothetical protein
VGGGGGGATEVTRLCFKVDASSTLPVVEEEEASASFSALGRVESVALRIIIGLAGGGLTAAAAADEAADAAEAGDASLLVVGLALLSGGELRNAFLSSAIAAGVSGALRVSDLALACSTEAEVGMTFTLVSGTAGLGLASAGLGV